MTSQPDDSLDPVAAAQGLTGALDGMTAELERLGRYGRRNRHLIVVVLISLALDIVLTIAVALVAVQAHDASARAATASASNLALCRASNVSRAQTIDLWEYVESLSGPPKTPAQRATRGKFDGYLHRLYGPRDCVGLGKKGA